MRSSAASGRPLSRPTGCGGGGRGRVWRVRRRGGAYEDAHFTICYSPVPDAAAPQGIGGILVSCVETTERVRTEQALRRLNDTLEAEVAQRTLERDRIWQVSEDLL